jgi:hemoglobin
VQLKRVLFGQFCYIFNAGCTYTGRELKRARNDKGVQQVDINWLIENL